MNDSLIKYNYRMIVEQSIENFIQHLNSISDEPISDEHREWLFEKGNEIFDAYYIADPIQVHLSSEKDKERLENYFKQIQDKLGGMFAHIMITEYKLFVLGIDN